MSDRLALMDDEVSESIVCPECGRVIDPFDPKVIQFGSRYFCNDKCKDDWLEYHCRCGMLLNMSGLCPACDRPM